MKEQTLSNPKTSDDSQREVDSSETFCSHLDLFSGIGGFALAAKWHGIETKAFCEIDPWARKVLAKNFPGVPIHDNVKTLQPEKYGRIDILTGGYPCQPFSLAGSRKGKDDERHLWPYMLNHIKAIKPRWVLAENVAGHVSMGLDTVLDDLEREGYETGSAILPACSKGAPHKRDRIWIFARRRESEPCRWGAEDCRKVSRGEIGDNGNFHRDLPDTTSGTIPERPKKQILGKSNIQIEFRRMGEVIGVVSEFCKSPIPGVIDGVSAGMDRFRKQRVIGLGNAIMPQVAYEILGAMISCENSITQRPKVRITTENPNPTTTDDEDRSTGPLST